MPSDADAANSPQPPSFEVALAELGDLVSRLESGSLGLSESIAAYERGVTLLRGLHQELAVAEATVSTLVRIDEQGRPVLAPAESPDSDDVSKPAPARAAGRKQRTRTLPGMDDGGGGG
ncbi:MAG: exodeoxyribonuclease VII small subunit [Planctomycetaceae bacterium]